MSSSELLAESGLEKEEMKIMKRSPRENSCTEGQEQESFLPKS